MSSSSFLQVGPAGFLYNGQQRIEDKALGKQLQESFQCDPFGLITVEDSTRKTVVEPFWAPIVAIAVKYKDAKWKLYTAYGTEFEFRLENLTLDEWDHFHGICRGDLHFVMSEAAQDEFFNLLDEFDDDSVTFKGAKFSTPPYFNPKAAVSEADFWTKKYNEEGDPGWELNAPSKPLVEVLSQLKLPKSRIAVLGCGSGNDAAHFAELGHVVTAFDFSPEAIAIGREKFGHLENLSFVQEDIFDLLPEFERKFDIVFEHTCFVAVDPKRRNGLVNLWSKLLTDEGHLLGVFFLTHFQTHPPFGSSEWEIEQRLSKSFHNIYWTRWKNSIPPRLGKELIVYSKKKRAGLDPQE